MSRFAWGNFLVDQANASEPSSPENNATSPDYTTIPPPTPDSGLRTIFFGPRGLRSGWRLLLYAVMVAALGMGLSAFAHLVLPRHLGTLRSMVVGEMIGLAAVMIPALVMARIEKRSFGDYGLPRESAFGSLFWIGAAWGIAGLTVLMLALRGSEVFYFGAIVIHGWPLFKFAAFWAVLFLVVGFFEEFMSRGYTQFTLTQGIGFWPAAAVLSVAFGAIHLGNQGEDRIGALAAAAIGLFFCLTLRRTGDLWFAVGFHASWDWGETYLYSVPNSGVVAPGHLLSSSFHGSKWLTGGSVGPEGSVLVFVVIALLWIVFHRTYPEVKYPEDKQQLTA